MSCLIILYIYIYMNNYTNKFLRLLEDQLANIEIYLSHLEIVVSETPIILRFIFKF